MSMTTDPLQEAPLLSNRTLRIVTAIVALFVVLMVAITLAGRMIGERIVLAGHTASTEPFLVKIGQDRLSLPANVIRFPQARAHGEAERVDIYLAWPEMTGYDTAISRRFNDLSRPGQLIFLQLAQSTMSRDMSGRLEPIYRGLFEGAAADYGAGLSLHRLRRDSAYSGEVILTGERPGQPAYTVRCILPDAGRAPSNADCQRDILVGRDLSVSYRFSSVLLADWRALDEEVRRYMESRLLPEPVPPVKNP